jgi:hypothetical protein
VSLACAFLFPRRAPVRLAKSVPNVAATTPPAFRLGTSVLPSAVLLVFTIPSQLFVLSLLRLCLLSLYLVVVAVFCRLCKDIKYRALTG